MVPFFDILENDLYIVMTNNAAVDQPVTLFDGTNSRLTGVQTVYSYTVPANKFPILVGTPVTVDVNGSPVTITAPQTLTSFIVALSVATGSTMTQYNDSANSNVLFYSAASGSNVLGTLSIGGANYSASSATAAGGTGISITLIAALSYQTFIQSLGSLENYYIEKMKIQATTQAQLSQPITVTRFINLFGQQMVETFCPPMNKYQPQFHYGPWYVELDIDGNNTASYTVLTGQTVKWRMSIKAYDVRKALGEKYEPTSIGKGKNGWEFTDQSSYVEFLSKTNK